NAEGYYVIPSLPPSSYSLSFESAGFTPYQQNNVTLLADQSLTVNASLTVGQASSTVSVEAQPTQVDTSTSTLSQVVEQKRIVDLPLNGRNAATLALLVPGAVQAPSGNSDQGVYKTFPAAVTVSANGSRANQTGFNLDGMSNNDVYTNVNQPFPFPDALQEFSVQTSDYTAKYGGNSGASVNIVTKSGNNELHGDAFEFVRNAVFNARNSFASRRDQLKRNQYGGTLGGPISIPHVYNGRNKTFFFVGYQGTQVRNLQNGVSATVPTPANLNGDFSALLSASNPNNPLGRAITIINPTTRLPFPGNIIPTSLLDPAALAFSKYLPVSSAAGNGRVFYSVPQAQTFNESLVRIDHSFSAADRLTGRYFFDRFNNNPFLNQSNYLSAVSFSQIDSHNALLTETHIFAPNLLNDFRLGLSRVYTDAGPPPGSINVNDLGLKLYQPPGTKTFDGINVSGYFNPNDFPPSIFARTNYSLSDDMSWVKGKHALSFGVTAARGQVILRNGFLASGQFGFSANVTNNALASFLLGNLTSFSQGAGEFKDNRDKLVGLYVQDDFHVSKRLTLNLGLRWEPFFPWEEVRGRVEQFRKENYYAGIRSQQFVNAPPGLLFPGDPGIPKYGVNGTYTNFSPRVGFAYDVKGDGKTSIRGGFGLFYDAQQIGIVNNRFVDVSPFSTQVSLSQPAGTFSNPYLGVANPFPSSYPPPKTAAFPAPVLVVTYDPANNSTMATPLIYNWNFTIEHQFAGGWLARAAYVGSHSSHLTETIELNPAVYAAGSTLSTDARRIFQGYGSVGQASQDINSSYQSLQLTAQRRLTSGLTVLANYTWSKALDDMPYGQGVAGISSQSDSPLPWFQPGRHQFDYGPTDFDHKQRFVLSYVYSTPALANANPYMRGVLGSWELTGIFTAQSGGPLTILAGQDTAQTGINTERAQLVSNQVRGTGACTTAPCRDYLNISAFAVPPAGAFGTVGKGFMRGPGLQNLDFGLLKNIGLHSERYRLQFHAEFFNVLNRVNLNNPNVSVVAAGFGTITGAGDPRIGQLALKLMF
ncbi:MAG: TonB-dependent receptor plug, partial [Bryobacterales bacterium]|nr:TonB-dependent receptor plug [Bryobacterales bacterium]